MIDGKEILCYIRLAMELKIGGGSCARENYIGLYRV